MPDEKHREHEQKRRREGVQVKVLEIRYIHHIERAAVTMVLGIHAKTNQYRGRKKAPSPALTL